MLYAFRDQLPPQPEDAAILCAQWSQQQEQAMAARRRWRGQLTDEPAAAETVSATETKDGIVLGPAYIYGAEPDPIRFFYGQLPDAGAGSRR